jgi:hypothetical protein
MPALDDARAHLAKAREFLEAAELTNDLGLFNAAASSAVTSGINSKDAICLTLTGRTRKRTTTSKLLPSSRQQVPRVARPLAPSPGC